MLAVSLLGGDGSGMRFANDQDEKIAAQKELLRVINLSIRRLFHMIIIPHT